MNGKEVNKMVLGVDISKKVFDVALLHRGHSYQAQFTNDAKGFEKLRHWLRDHDATSVYVCMEATGGYEFDLALFLHEGGHTVSVVNPARIKRYGESKLRRIKSDKADAALIADFCRTQQPAPWTPPTPALRALQAMVRHLTALETMYQQESNRLEHLPPAPEVCAALEAHLAFLASQMVDLKRQIGAHLQRHPALRRDHDLLDSIPGIGTLTAARLLAELGDIRAFEGAPQVAAYAGLAPHPQRSGSSVRRRTQLTSIGSRRLRQALFFPPLSAMQHNPIIHALAERLRQRGKLPMVIVGAAMRKLIHLAYGVLKSGVPFDPHYATP
jgi:transposase